MRLAKELMDAIEAIGGVKELSKDATKKFCQKYKGKKLIAKFEEAQGSKKSDCFDKLYVFIECPGIGGPKGVITMSKDPYYIALQAAIEMVCQGDGVSPNLQNHNDCLFVYRLDSRQYKGLVELLKNQGVEIEISDSISSEEIDENDSDYGSEASDLVARFSSIGLTALGFNPKKIKALARKYEEEQEQEEE